MDGHTVVKRWQHFPSKRDPMWGDGPGRCFPWGSCCGAARGAEGQGCAQGEAEGMGSPGL